MLKIYQAKVLMEKAGSCGFPVSEVVFGWRRHSDDVSSLPKGERDKLDHLASLIVDSYAQSDCAPYREVEVAGHADKDWQGRGNIPLGKSTPFEDSVSHDRAVAVDEYLKKVVPDLWKKRSMGPIPPGGIAHVDVSWWGSTRLIAPPYHEQNRRVEVTITPQGAPIPPPSNDSFSKRVRRAAKLIESGRKVTPDTGWQTKRAYMLLQQLLKPNANDKAVDGEKSNEVINGKRALNERGMPTALCGFPGNWDPPELSGVDFDKFFFHIMPILQGPGWAPTVSDDTVLQVLGAVQTRISEGINLTDEYIAHNKSDFGYTGDRTRTKLQNEYVRRMKDENDIYWIYRSPF
jgi:hypothetical protein